MINEQTQVFARELGNTKPTARGPFDGSIKAKSDAAADRLRDDPDLPGVLLSKEWHALHMSFRLKDLPKYEELAALEGYQIVQIVQLDAGGMEHLLFLTRYPNVCIEELLACNDSPNESAAPSD